MHLLLHFRYYLLRAVLELQSGGSNLDYQDPEVQQNCELVETGQSPSKLNIHLAAVNRHLKDEVHPQRAMYQHLVGGSGIRMRRNENPFELGHFSNAKR